LIQTQLPSTSVASLKSQLVSELADCYGMMGGIYRRWGLKAQDEKERKSLLLESTKSYKNGYDIESNKEYGIVDSYNMVNRLVSQILLDFHFLSNPALAANYEGLEPIDVREELQKAEMEIREQLRGKRRGDVWALADLPLVSLLLDKDDPRTAYASFHAQSPPDYAYESALDTLRPLAEFDLPMQKNLQDAVEQLESRLHQLRR
jgi:hypothetical protein